MDYSKYAKLRKARMPEQEIRDVMTDDGFLPMEINKFFHSTRKALPAFLPKPRKVVDNVITPINPGKNEIVVQKVHEMQVEKLKLEQAALSKLTPEEIEVKIDEKESEKLHYKMRHEHYNKLGSIFATHRATAISILSPANSPRRSLELPAPMSETEHAKNQRRKSNFEGEFVRLLEKKKASTLIDEPDPMQKLPPVINKDNSALFKTMLDTHIAKKKANEVALEKIEPSQSKKPIEDAGSDEQRHKSSRMAHFSKLGKVFSAHKISSKSIVRYPKLVEFHKESLPFSKDNEVLAAEEAPKTDFGGDLMVALPSPPKTVVSSTDMTVKLAPVNISKSNAPLVKSMLAKHLNKKKGAQEERMKLSPEEIQKLTTSEDEFKARNSTRKAYLLKVGAVFAAKNLNDGYMSHFVVSKTGAKPILIDKDLLKTLPDTQTPTFGGDFANLLKEAPKVVIDDLQTGDVYKAPEKVIVVSQEATKTKDYVKAMLEQNAAKKRDEMAKLAQDEAENVKSSKTEYKSHDDQKKAHFAKIGKAFSRHFLQLKAPNTPATVGELPDEDGMPFAQSEHVRQQKRNSFMGDYTSQALRKTPTGTRKSDLSRQAAGAEAFHEDKDMAEEEVVAMVQKAQSVLPVPRSTAAIVKTPLQLKAENAALVKASLEKLIAKKQEKQQQLASLKPEMQQKEEKTKVEAKQHEAQKKSHYAKFAGSVMNKPSYTSMMPAIHGRQKEAGVAAVPDAEVVAQVKQSPRRASVFKGDFSALVGAAEEAQFKDKALVPKSANYALKVLSQITSQKKEEKAALAAADPIEFKRVEDEKAKLVARNADRKAHFSKLNAIFATHRPTNASAVASPRIDVESASVDATFSEGRKSDHTGDAMKTLRRSPPVTNRAQLSERDAAVNSFFEAMVQEEAEQAAQDAVHYQVYLDTLQKAKLMFPTARKATEIVKPSLPGDFKSAAFAKSLLDTFSAQRKDEKQIFAKVDPEEFKKHEDAKSERKQRDGAKKSHYAKMGNILSTRPPFVSMIKKMDGELKDKAADLPDAEFIAKLRRGSVFKQDFGALMRRTPKPVKDQSETRNGQFAEMLLEKHNNKKYSELEDLARNNPKELEYVMKFKDETSKREVEKKAHLQKLGKIFAPHKPVGASVMRSARVDVASHSLDAELAEAIRLSFQGDVSNVIRTVPRPIEKREEAEERVEYMRDYIRALMTGEDDEFRMAAMAKARQVRRILPTPRPVVEAVKPPPAVDHKNASFIKAMLEKHIAKKNDEQKELSNLSPEDRQQRLDDKGMTAKRYKEKIEHFSKMGETFRPPPSGIVQVSALLLNQARTEVNVASPPATADVFYRNSYGPIVDIDPNLSVETEATVRSPPKIKIAMSKITPADDEKKVEVQVAAAPATQPTSAFTKFLSLLGLLSKPSTGKRAPRTVTSQARAVVTKVDAVDKYTKYRNLLRMNFTNQCVKERMTKDGLTRRDIDLFFNPLAADNTAKSSSGGMLLSPAFKVANAVSTAKELRSPIQVKSVAGPNDKVRNEVFFLELLEKHLLEKQRDQVKLKKMDPDERLTKKMIHDREEKQRTDKISYYSQMGVHFTKPTGPRSDKKEFTALLDDTPDIRTHRLSMFSGDFNNLLRRTNRLTKNNSPRIS